MLTDQEPPGFSVVLIGLARPSSPGIMRGLRDDDMGFKGSGSSPHVCRTDGLRGFELCLETDHPGGAPEA